MVGCCGPRQFDAYWEPVSEEGCQPWFVGYYFLLQTETFTYTGLLPPFLFHFLKVFQNKFSLLVLLALGLDFHFFWSSSETVTCLDCLLPRKPPHLVPTPDMLTVSKRGLGMGFAFWCNYEGLRGHL